MKSIGSLYKCFFEKNTISMTVNNFVNDANNRGIIVTSVTLLLPLYTIEIKDISIYQTTVPG